MTNTSRIIDVGLYALCVAIVFISRINANEMLTKVMFKVIEHEDRFDSLEAQFKTSLLELESRLNDKIDKVTATLQINKPATDEMIQDIKITISDTVTGLVKSKFISIAEAMKREKKALVQAKNDIMTSMKQMDTHFADLNNKTAEYTNSHILKMQENFTRQTMYLEENYKNEVQECKEIKEVLHSDSVRLRNDFREAQYKIDERFNNHTQELDVRYDSMETELKKALTLFQNETSINLNNFENNFTKTLDNLVGNELKIGARISSHDQSLHAIRSTQSRNTNSITEIVSDMQSYKSSADSTGYRVDRIVTKLSKHSSFYAERSNHGENMSRGTMLLFRKVYRNEGNDFSSLTAYYTAPETGVYLFWFSIEAKNNKEAKVCLYSGYTNTGMETFEKDGGGAGQVAFLYVTAGTKVSVRACMDEPSYVAHARTVFSGVLLYTY